ncbi:MAG TPA: hypothetical protein VF459_20890, partial [Caulobacteraceae bacterium]
ERVAEAMERRLLRLADALDGTAEEQAATNAAINAASLTFDRANRGIRLALMLETKVQDRSLAGLLKRREERAAKAAARRTQVDERRGEVLEAVDAAIDAEEGAEERDYSETQDLRDRAEDWLHELADETVLALPAGAMIEQVLTHVGLAFDAEWFEHENWAVEERETRPPGSPYAVPQTVWRQRSRALQAAEAPEPQDQRPP